MKKTAGMSGVLSVSALPMILAAVLAFQTAGAEDTSLFEDAAAEKKIFKWHEREKNSYGGARNISRYNTTPLKKTVLMQRSGRKRLFDHNILLRALFDGKISHSEYGDLSALFSKAVFIDIGSAILYGEGAPTVRDIYEDRAVREALGSIIATDIEDPSSAKTRYISLYRASENQLPFPVLEIDMLMSQKKQFDLLIKNCGAPASKDAPVVFRSVNSGPDLFYSSAELRLHFSAMLESCENRELIYLFSKYVLYKAKGKISFQVIGEIDAAVGVEHNRELWRTMDWSKRTISRAFFPNSKLITVKK